MKTVEEIRAFINELAQDPINQALACPIIIAYQDDEEQCVVGSAIAQTKDIRKLINGIVASNISGVSEIEDVEEIRKSEDVPEWMKYAAVQEALVEGAWISVCMKKGIKLPSREEYKAFLEANTEDLVDRLTRLKERLYDKD